MIYLMNSAVMPAGCYGTYTYSRAGLETLADVVAGIYGEWESRIGYPQNLDLIERWTGVRPPLNRAETVFRNGDRAFVMRLAKRVAAPATKGAPVSNEPKDWEFAWVDFAK